jgi:hypothetical protein
MPQIIQRFTGINALAYYGPAISLSLSPRIAQIFGGCGSTCFWIGSICPVFFIEKVGRRQIGIWGLVTCAMFMGGLCAATGVSQNDLGVQRQSG